MYITRHIESKFLEVQNDYKVVLVTGPRQVGKTTMLKNLIKKTGKEREYVTLDNLNELELSKDANNFFSIHKPPILIDEIQYAPNLFIKIKELIDNGCSNGDFWITGSQSYNLMGSAFESLAGRIAIIEMQSMSQSEIDGKKLVPFDLNEIKNKKINGFDVDDCFKRIYKGSMPSVINGDKKNVDDFYQNYVMSYIERDVKFISKSIDGIIYYKFIKILAARIGQIINVNEIARELDLNVKAINNYLAILETLGIIFFEYPYSNNLLKRTVKKPKLYFWDLGLATHIINWGNYQVVRDSSLNGVYFENYVISEIRKNFLNKGLRINTYYYRNKDGNEIDFINEMNGELHFIEIKMNTNINKNMIRHFGSIKVEKPYTIGKGAVICPIDRLSMIDDNNLIVPAGLI